MKPSLSPCYIEIKIYKREEEIEQKRGKNKNKNHNHKNNKEFEVHFINCIQFVCLFVVYSTPKYYLVLYM